MIERCKMMDGKARISNGNGLSAILQLKEEDPQSLSMNTLINATALNLEDGEVKDQLSFAYQRLSLMEAMESDKLLQYCCVDKL